MKSPLLVLVSIVATSIVVPIMISVTSYESIDAQPKLQQSLSTKSTNKTSKIINYETINKEAPNINVYNTKINKTQSMNIEEYLYGVLAGEMPSEFDIEALKAQAVAARTFVLYKDSQEKSSKHKDAVVCTDYTHCQEYKSYDELKQTKGDEWIKNSYPIIKQAIDETKGQIIVYDNKPILTLYFSTSSGKTENSEEVFSSNYPYLKSVDSPYDKNYSPKYESLLELANDEFVNILKKTYSDIQITQSNLKSQVNIVKRSEGGSVETIKLGNKEVTGRDIRSIFNLNSSNFDISFNNDALEFKVKGYGHGVGMSQWGAQGMAKDGYKYYEILQHYYTGTDIKDTY